MNSANSDTTTITVGSAFAVFIFVVLSALTIIFCIVKRSRTKKLCPDQKIAVPENIQVTSNVSYGHTASDNDQLYDEAAGLSSQYEIINTESESYQPHNLVTNEDHPPQSSRSTLYENINTDFVPESMKAKLPAESEQGEKEDCDSVQKV